MDSIIERFEAALAADEELPIISATEHAALIAEVAASDLSDQEEQDIQNSCRYKGRGFGVDTTLTPE